MRNSKFKSLLCLCVHLYSWLLRGAESNCEVLEFPGAENHRFIAQIKWFNFFFQLKDDECTSSKLTEIRVYRANGLLCHLQTENGSCTVLGGSICGCSEQTRQFTFLKMIERDDAKEWRWAVRHDQITIDECVVTFSLNLSQEPNDRDNSSDNCRNRLPVTRSIITSTSVPDQDSPIVMRSTSENVTAVLGEMKSVDFLVQARTSQITNCTLSKTGDGAVSPASHTCTVKWEMQGEDQIGGGTHSIVPTGSKCLCSFLQRKDSNVSLTIFITDTSVNDSGRWSVKVKNSLVRGQAEFTLIVTDNTNDSPIVMRSSSESVTAVLGERKSVNFLVQTRTTQITNCTLSKIFQGTGDGRDSAASPASHTCAVKWEMQGIVDQIGGESRPTGPTGSKCLCSFRRVNTSNVLLTVFLFDSRVNDSGRWSVKVKNSHSRGQAEFTLDVTDNTYAVREPEKESSSIPIVPILLTVVACMVVVGMVSFMCWRRKTKAVFQEPDYRSTPIVNNSLAIRKLPSTSSMSSINSLSNQTLSSRLLRVSRDQTRNRQTESQVQETNAPTNVVCEVNCSNEPVILDTGVKTSRSAVDMKLVLYIKGYPVNPETPPVVSPTSAGLEYLNPCSPMYATVEERNLPGTYQNDIGGDRYMAMSPPRYSSMPRSMTENAGVSEYISSDPQKNNFYSNFEENSNTTILHLNCENAYDKKLAEASEYDKKLAEASEYDKKQAEASEYSVIS